MGILTGAACGKEEAPCGHTCMPKKLGGKEEVPCGHTCMPKKLGGKEEIC